MKTHWRVLLGMGLGILLGFLLAAVTEAPAWSGLRLEADGEAGLVVAEARGPAARAGLSAGQRLVEVTERRGGEREQRTRLAEPAEFAAVLARQEQGALLHLTRDDGRELGLQLALDPDSTRARWLAPFEFVADLFIGLLRMLIVPLVLASVVAGVASVGSLGNLRRIGLKTFGYYVVTSLLAIFVGQVLVNLIRPGDGAALGLPLAEGGSEQLSLIEILRRMVPDNVPAALSDNGEMLAIIFFALVLGVSITRTAAPHGERIRDLFDSFFQVMLTLAAGVLWLLPFGVFALMVRVVASTGFDVFEPLLLYMGTVTLALVLHAGVTLPAILRFGAGISPWRWAKAMSPAIVTAFSTSSSSMTLPVTLETVERRGFVSNRVSGFTLPLGSTVNMDGTALYECVAVIFLAQYYASVGGVELTFTAQATVVILALLASIGAAGIPSAGLVMMLTILSALDLPLEGAALLLAVDRPLDMMRTMTNVWSDTCAAAVIARSEGEEGPLEAGR